MATMTKAIILAAGSGRRLGAVAESMPKCMVPVNGTRIVDNQIGNLKAAGISDICVVAGHRADVLTSHLAENWPDVTVVINPRYRETNNMYSLFLARNFVCGVPFILMNGDVFFDCGVLESLLGSGGESSIVCERGIYLEESMKIVFNGRKISRIGKNVPECESWAVSADIYLFSASDGKILFDEIEETITVRHDENSWTEVALDRIFSRTSFVPFEIPGRWFEIDTEADLRAAEALFPPR